MPEGSGDRRLKRGHVVPPEARDEGALPRAHRERDPFDRTKEREGGAIIRLVRVRVRVRVREGGAIMHLGVVSR